MTQKRWHIVPYSQAEAKALHEALHINEKLCRILTQRGLRTFEASRNFFRPQLEHLHSPWLMKDMHKATARIAQALLQKEKILIFGDYDVDGTTSVATVYSFFRKIYFSDCLDFYIPHRYREGYGVSKAGIDYAHQNGFTLIIALDCGVKSVELIAYAKTLGVDFIVCDHHLPGNELPPAVAILNPKQEDCTYPYKDLCGCGIGFKLICAIAEQNGLPLSEAYEYLDLVATAIAADIVPITDENRVLAYYGLKKINSTPGTGIKALMDLSQMKMPVSISDVVFMIAPRVNAAGRMDDARKAVQLFIEKDATDALALAEQLHADNTDRRDADRTITEEALYILQEQANEIDRWSTVVYREHWHKGVVGIVASRLIETYYRPTVVLTRSGEFASGSARSVPGFNLYEAIYACREYLVTYGGHFAAAGLTLKADDVDAFSKKFEDTVSATLPASLRTPEIRIDAEITFADLTPGFYNIIKQMEPFGPENMRPVFVTRGVRNTGYSKVLKEKHLRLVVTDGHATMSGIGFNMCDKMEMLTGPVDVVYSIEENEWNGAKNLQLKVIDLAPAGQQALA